MDYVEISNSMIVYLLCGITVAIAFVQAVLYIRMAILEKFVAKKVPKIREYNLGIAMIIGMLFAIIYDMAVGA